MSGCVFTQYRPDEWWCETHRTLRIQTQQPARCEGCLHNHMVPHGGVTVRVLGDYCPLPSPRQS